MLQRRIFTKLFEHIIRRRVQRRQECSQLTKQTTGCVWHDGLRSSLHVLCVYIYIDYAYDVKYGRFVRSTFCKIIPNESNVTPERNKKKYVYDSRTYHITRRKMFNDSIIKNIIFIYA